MVRVVLLVPAHRQDRYADAGPDRASARLNLMTGLIAVLGLWLPMGPLAAGCKLENLPRGFFACLVVFLVGDALLTTLTKRIYIQRFGWQEGPGQESRSRLVRTHFVLVFKPPRFRCSSPALRFRSKYPRAVAAPREPAQY